MKNIREVTNEDGTKTTIEILFGFDIKEYNKHYVAYTIDDDGKQEMVDVLISELDDNNVIKSIPFEEREEVYAAYEEAKKLTEELN